MNLNQLLLLGTTSALVALGPAFPVQETLPSAVDEPASGASPVRPFLDKETPFDTAADTEFTLRERLGFRDLDAREAAFDAAARRAARNPDSRRALRVIAADESDPDLAFTARLALREADRLASWGRAGSGFGGQGLPSRPDNPFDAMRLRMEALFGTDPFVDEFFGVDPFFARPYQGSGAVFGADPFSAADPFDVMRKRIEEMSRNRRTQDADQSSSGARSSTKRR